MAFLAPAAAGAVSSTAGASALASLASGAGTASTALGAGLSAGATLGGGASMLSMPALSYAGANLAAPGIMGALPAASTAGIFANAAPALGGLSSLTPAVTQAAPGIFSQAAPALGGLKSLTPLASQATNPASWSAVNQAAGLGDLGFKSAQLNPSFLKTADIASKASTNTGLLGQGAKFKDLPSVVQNAPSVTSPEYAARAREIFQPSISASGTPIYQSAGYGVPELAKTASAVDPSKGFLSNAISLAKNPSMQGAVDYIETHPYASAGAAYGLYSLLKPKDKPPPKEKAFIRPYEYTQTQRPEAYAESPLSDTSERMYFDTSMTAKAPYEAPGPEYAADGGLMGYAVGGPVETMAAMNAVGANTGYPMAGINTAMYSNPMVQRPEAVNVISPSGDAGVSAYSGEPKFAEGGDTKDKAKEPPYAYTYDPKTLQFTQTKGPKVGSTVGGIGALVGGQGAAPVAATPAYPALSIPAYQTPEQRLGLTDFYAMMDRRLGQMGGYAEGGGISDLGSYSDGGRLLKGPGDGVSDSIPAVIGERQPARLADGEFVVPARIVSELGNGSTEAGARKLYAMMDRVQKARGKTVGKNKVATNTRADKHLPA